MRITTKTENYHLYEAGMFGNKVRTWNSLGEVYQDGYEGNVTMRYKEPGSKFCQYDVKLHEVFGNIKEWVSRGAQLSKIAYNEACPNHLLLVQGELMHTTTGWHLFYSTEPNKPMRVALEDGRTAIGLAALDMIRRTSTLASYEDLMELFERYPDSVVEFGTYSRNLGILPRRNTIIWEVRNY